MMVDEKLERARAILSSWAGETDTPEAGRLDVTVAANDLVPAVAALNAAEWGYLAAITGVDLGFEANALEVLYHFCEGAAVLTLRVTVPYEAAEVPSLSKVIPSASFFERELREMLGVEVAGLENKDYLFLPEAWPEGVYPLRKNFQSGDVDSRVMMPPVNGKAEREVQ